MSIPEKIVGYPPVPEVSPEDALDRTLKFSERELQEMLDWDPRAQVASTSAPVATDTVAEPSQAARKREDHKDEHEVRARWGFPAILAVLTVIDGTSHGVTQKLSVRLADLNTFGILAAATVGSAVFIEGCDRLYKNRAGAGQNIKRQAGNFAGMLASASETISGYKLY